MKSLAQRMSQARQRREKRGWNYEVEVKPLIEGCEATEDALRAAVAPLLDGKGTQARKGVLAAGRRLLGIDRPYHFAIVKNEDGKSHGFDVGGGAVRAMTADECKERGLVPGPLNY